MWFEFKLFAIWFWKYDHVYFSVIADVNTSYAEAKLRDTDTNKIITTPIDPNQPGPQPIRWTNHVNWKEIDIEISFKFPDLGKPPDYDPKGEQHFVIDFKYGVVHASMQLKHYKGIFFNSAFNLVILFLAIIQLLYVWRTFFLRQYKIMALREWWYLNLSISSFCITGLITGRSNFMSFSPALLNWREIVELIHVIG